MVCGVNTSFMFPLAKTVCHYFVANSRLSSFCRQRLPLTLTLVKRQAKRIPSKLGVTCHSISKEFKSRPEGLTSFSGRTPKGPLRMPSTICERARDVLKPHLRLWAWIQNEGLSV